MKRRDFYDAISLSMRFFSVLDRFDWTGGFESKLIRWRSIRRFAHRETRDKHV